MLSQFARVRNHRGQAIVEFALVVPILLLLLLGAIDFGRAMQARLTSEAAVRAGASWGAAHFANAVTNLGPDYGAGSCPARYAPSCNIGYQTCTEAAGFPGFSGGATLASKAAGQTYLACMTGNTVNVCQPSASQSNPYVAIIWRRPDGSTYSPGTVGSQPRVGDTIEVDGTFCFSTFINVAYLPHQMTWTSKAYYVITP